MSNDDLVNIMPRASLRASEWIEVRSKAEILATLDDSGSLDGLQFMPEMFQYCGQRLRVYKSAHKTCDTVKKTGGRRMADTVHLEELRCDGAAHGGCGAACLIFWKTAWLKKVTGPNGDGASAAALAPQAAAPGGAPGSREADVWAATQVAGTDPQNPTYACQATRLLEASTPLSWWDLRQYVDDYRSGNVTVRRLLDGGAYVLAFELITLSGRVGRKLGLDVRSPLIQVYDWIQRRRGGVPFPRRTGPIPAGQKTPDFKSNLQPGELVRVKPYDEILATLDEESKNRGLYFDAEHVPFCGGTFRVRSRVAKIVDEVTGKMLHFKSGCIILEGAFCLSRYSDRRMYCPRAIFPYWREIWLERVGEEASAAAAPGPAAREGLSAAAVTD